MYIQKRNIVLCIIFSIITCGFYGIYWMVCLANDTNQASGRQNDTSGGLVVLFTFLTCGIYQIYWCYKAGEKIDQARIARGMYAKNSGIIYLLLTVFSLSIVAWALMQNELNEISDMAEAKG